MMEREVAAHSPESGQIHPLTEALASCDFFFYSLKTKQNISMYI